ncbi:Protein Wnt-11b-2 [Bienertia sinuspersici]
MQKQGCNIIQNSKLGQGTAWKMAEQCRLLDQAVVEDSFCAYNICIRNSGILVEDVDAEILVNL